MARVRGERWALVVLRLAWALLLTAALVVTAAPLRAQDAPPKDAPPAQSRPDAAPPDTAPATPPVVTAGGKDGFTIRNADGSTFLRIRGYIQADAQFYVRDSEVPLTDTFVLRRVRPVFEGTIDKYFDYKFMPDFGAGTTVMQDVYVDWKIGKPVRMMVGKYKSPVGLERLVSARDLLFVSREFVTNIVPNRDIGITFHGDPFDGLLSYAVGIFNGVPDGASSDQDTNDGKESAARLFVLPFRKTSKGALRGLGVGIAGTYGRNVGTPKSPGLSSYLTPGLNTFFSWLNDGTQATAPTAAGTTVGDGRRARLTPQAYWYVGRFGALAEYARSTTDVAVGSSSATLTSEAWDVTVSILLTGDVASYQGVTPKRQFDPEQHQWGAFELVARAGAQTVDRNAFPTYADPAKSARAARDRGFGFNWYLSRNFRLMLDYIETRFAGGAAGGGDREDERAILNRFQVSW